MIASASLDVIAPQTHTTNTTMTIYAYPYDNNGYAYTNSHGSCITALTYDTIIHTNTMGYSNTFYYTFSDTNFTKEGTYILYTYCEQNGNGTGVSATQYITVTAQTSALWSCPLNTHKENFFYAVILFGIIMIVIALLYRDVWLFGVLGGTTLALSYFFIGACAPIMTLPLLVIGVLSALYFVVS